MRRRRILSLMVWNLLAWIAAAQLSGGAAAQAQAPAKIQSDQQAQIEKGRQVIGEVCGSCHTNILRMVQVHKKSPDQWKDTVYSIVGRGAQVMPDEIDAVTAFLTANAGSNRETNAQASQEHERSINQVLLLSPSNVSADIDVVGSEIAFTYNSVSCLTQGTSMFARIITKFISIRAMQSLWRPWRTSWQLA